MNRNKKFEGELLGLLEKYGIKPKSTVKELSVTIAEDKYPKINSELVYNLEKEE